MKNLNRTDQVIEKGNKWWVPKNDEIIIKKGAVLKNSKKYMELNISDKIISDICPNYRLDRNLNCLKFLVFNIWWHHPSWDDIIQFKVPFLRGRMSNLHIFWNIAHISPIISRTHCINQPPHQLNGILSAILVNVGKL